jgi:diguanylate cyclase (GGDEF)-like protein
MKNFTFKKLEEKKLELLKSRFNFILSSILEHLWEIDFSENKIYISVSKEEFSKELREQYSTVFKKIGVDIEKYKLVFDAQDKFSYFSHRELSYEDYSYNDIHFRVNQEETYIDVKGRKVLQDSEVTKIFGVWELLQNTSEDRRNLYNHIYKRDELEQTLHIEVERSRRYKNPLSVLFVSIDNFEKLKEENSVEVLDVIFAELLQDFSNLKRTTDILGRWREEQFVFIAFETSINDSLQFANKLKKVVEDKSFIDDIKISCSFGAEEFNMRLDTTSLINRAQDALLYAKKEGGNRVERYREI